MLGRFSNSISRIWTFLSISIFTSNGSRYLATLCLALVSCQTSPTQPVSKTAKITHLQQITALPSDSQSPQFDLKKLDDSLNNQLGYLLMEAETGKILESHNADRPFIPASTSKVPTTIAALNILGGNYRFKTSLAYRGKIEKHTLNGDLYLKGTGDPSLKVADLFILSQSLVDRSIHRITGHFYYDESLFKSEETIENEREPWASYNTGVSALSSEFNQMNVYWSPSQSLDGHQIYSAPNLPFVRFGILPQTLSSETHFLYKKEGGTDQWLLSEDLASGGRSRLPIKNPGLATASLFSDLCATLGLKLPFPERGVLSKTGTILVTHESEPLVKLVEGILEYSNNLMAELVQLAAAHQLVNHPVSVLESTQIIQKWMLTHTPELGKYSFENGSGLTSKNRISPEQMALILKFSEKNRFNGRTYESLLATGGFSGDLAHRYSMPGLALRVHAKTGSMNYANSMIGFLHPESGKKLIFAIMTTNWDARSQLDKSSVPLSDDELKRIYSWSRSAHRLEDALLFDWIAKY